MILNKGERILENITFKIEAVDFFSFKQGSASIIRHQSTEKEKELNLLLVFKKEALGNCYPTCANIQLSLMIKGLAYILHIQRCTVDYQQDLWERDGCLGLGQLYGMSIRGRGGGGWGCCWSG